MTPRSAHARSILAEHSKPAFSKFTVLLCHSNGIYSLVCECWLEVMESWIQTWSINQIGPSVNRATSCNGVAALNCCVLSNVWAFTVDLRGHCCSLRRDRVHSLCGTQIQLAIEPLCTLIQRRNTPASAAKHARRPRQVLQAGLVCFVCCRRSSWLSGCRQDPQRGYEDDADDWLDPGLAQDR